MPKILKYNRTTDEYSELLAKYACKNQTAESIHQITTYQTEHQHSSCNHSGNSIVDQFGEQQPLEKQHDSPD